MHKISSRQLTILLLSFLLLFLIELFFSHNGSALFLLVGTLFLYMGLTKKKKSLLLGSIIFLSLALFTMWSMQLLLIALLAYMLLVFIQQKQDTLYLTPITALQTEPNPLIAETVTEQPFKWQDVQIKRLLGHLTIDTTQTILPKGRSFISVQQTFGQVRIIVPYEVSAHIHYTAFYGEATIFQAQQKLLNEKCVFQDTAEHPRELVIFVAAWIGDVEVSRG